MRLELGEHIHCSDGALGVLADVVVDPTSKRVTHLVVQPHKLDGGPRLVPVELVEGGDGEPKLTVRCTIEEATQLSTVQERAYLRLGELPVSDPDWDIGTQEVLAMPYYEGGFGDCAGEFDSSYGVIYDRVPKGEVEIRRGSAVTAANGDHLGQVDGFVVDADDRITHLVLDKGHLWGRREVTIPIGAADKVEADAVIVRLSKEEVGRLPSVRLHRWF
jgi:sporulation protein YlmC with PRC-barrel domain